jgi:phosphoribosylformimino-5-aminoimidazole carboxamide ribotide isomerase
MRIIPVLDVMNGEVVRGVGGRRSEYLPIVSRLTTSTDPVDVARALVETFHPRDLYLADLDALRGAPRNLNAYRGILALGARLWVDAGIADVDEARVVADAGCDVVVGLETVPTPEMLAAIVAAIGSERVIFSLDLKDGVPLRDSWDRSPTLSGQVRTPVPTAREIAARAIACGVHRLIVLDLARVGGGAGTGTDELCRQIASDHPEIEVIAGGGVAGPKDLTRLQACGVQGVLVASALHDGRISSED